MRINAQRNLIRNALRHNAVRIVPISHYVQFSRMLHLNTVSVPKLDPNVTPKFNDWNLVGLSHEQYYGAGCETRLPFLEKLLDGGFDLNDPSAPRSLICLAAQRGSVKSVSLLLSRGANVHGITNNELGTALYFAAGSGSIDTIKILLKAGADPNMINESTNMTPIEFTNQTIVNNLKYNYGRNNPDEFISDMKLIRTTLLKFTKIRPELLKQAMDMYDCKWIVEIINAKKHTISNSQLLTMTTFMCIH